MIKYQTESIVSKQYLAKSKLPDPTAIITHDLIINLIKCIPLDKLKELFSVQIIDPDSQENISLINSHLTPGYITEELIKLSKDKSIKLNVKITI